MRPCPPSIFFVLALREDNNAIDYSITGQPYKCLYAHQYHGCGIIDPERTELGQTNALRNPVPIIVEQYYLRDVITTEMNVGEIPPTEQELPALKAQAIAARTVASWKVANLPFLNDKNELFEGVRGINNSTQYQVFIPGSYDDFPSAQDLIDRAITETQGQFLSYLPDGTNPDNGTRMVIDAEFSSDIILESKYGNQAYLQIVQEPISSSTCNVQGAPGNDWGMSQRGAIRWAIGNTCPDKSGTAWPVTWTDYRQILAHYYTGIDIIGTNTPNNRWNLLQYDPPVPNPNEANYTLNNVYLQNTSTLKWNANEIVMGYQWTARGAQATGQWTTIIPFSFELDKGLSTTLSPQTIPNPSDGQSGNLTLHLDLRHANDENSWFSSAGWPDATIDIDGVTGPTATVTFTPTPTGSDLSFGPYCNVTLYNYETCEVSNNGRLLHIHGQAPQGTDLSPYPRVINYEIVNSGSPSSATLNANVSYVANREEPTYIAPSDWFDLDKWVTTSINSPGDYNFQNSSQVSFNSGSIISVINLEISYDGPWYIMDLDVWLSLDGVYVTSTPTRVPPDYTPPPTSTPEPPSSNPCVMDALYVILSSLSKNTSHMASLRILPYLQQTTFDIELFRRVEDEVLSQTPEGQHYIDIYYGHGEELVELLTNNTDLRDEAVATLQLWEPNLQALVDGEGSTVTITSGQVQSIQTFLDHLYAAGSTELRQTIDSERTLNPLEDTIGMTMDQASVSLVDYQVPSSVTPTFTPTLIPTGTWTPTLTSTETPTATSVPTSTPTYTSTSTPTPTAIATSTSTNTATSTPTPTAIATSTFTNTPTPTATSTSTATPSSGFIFSDGFESGNLSAWSSNATDSGDLSVSADAAAIGSYGMAALLDDSTSIQVTDSSPNAEKSYNLRFYLNPNSIATTNQQEVTILAARQNSVGWAFCLGLSRYGGDYKLTPCTYNDSRTWNSGKGTFITDDWQAIEMEWQAASAAGANDGTLKLWVNDELMETISNIDNDTQAIDFVSLGALPNIPSGASGTMYFDGFTSTNGSHIGLDANGPALSSPLTGLVFRDNFESNDFSAWDNTATDNGDLSISTSAALSGIYGMQAVIDDTTAIYAIDKSPTSEQTYWVRFQFDPNSLVIPTYQDFSILIGGTDYSNRYLLMLSGNPSDGYNLQALARSDDGSWISGAYAEISDSPHQIEVEYKTASTAGANDGSLTLWVDDTLIDTIAGLDNDTRLIESVYLGAIGYLDAGTSGTIYFDAFESYNLLRPVSSATATP
jgi:hypothetical protein